MLNNLYTFKKDSWFFKFYQWLWKSDPVHEEFKNMCPMFWAMFFSTIFLPFMLIRRYFVSESFLDYLSKRRERIEATQKSELHDARDAFISSPTYKNKLILIRKAKKYFGCVSEDAPYYAANMLDEEMRDIFYNLSSPTKDKINSFVSSKFMKVVGKIFTWCAITGGALVILYGLYRITLYIMYLSTLEPDWNLITALGIITASIATFVFIILSDTTSGIWRGIGKFFSVVCATIYAIYKKNCPRITWED